MPSDDSTKQISPPPQQQQHLQEANLYKDSTFKRILHKAVHIAYEKGKDITPLDFMCVDMLHYLGVSELDYAAKQLNIGCSTRVVDVGCGAGGPARYLSWNYKCKVTGIEYQPEMARVAHVLNNLLSSSDDVTIECGDFTTMQQPHEKFDVLLSQLTMLHIPDKDNLYRNCSAFLKEGASFFIEDYFAKEEIPENVQSILMNDISIPDGYLPTKQEYINFLEKNGLVVDVWLEKTDEWITFIWDRSESYLHAIQNGREEETQLLYFYLQVAKVFSHIHTEDTEKQENFYMKYPLTLKATNLSPQCLQNSVQCVGGVVIMGHKK